MYHFVKLALACFATLAFTSARTDASLLLFGIQENGALAERLPYGPTAIVESDSAFLNTLVGSQLHDRWYQTAVDGTGSTLYEIEWQFSNKKSVAQRFQDAVDFGEVVNWTVNSPSIAAPQTMSGTWRFSSAAGDLFSKFDGSSGAGFVSEGLGNGIWGAGPGVIDGTSGPIFPGTLGDWRWGIGNLNGSDFFTPFANSGTFVLDGNLQTSLPDGFKNYMYVDQNSAVPEPSSIAIFGLLSLTALGIRRGRSRGLSS